MEELPATFRAYQYESFGDPFQEIKLRARVPQQTRLQPHEVRVRVHSAALNPVATSS